ncbi:unnamed protein product [Dovyalis caffra]|uniref:Uncharacterized protein n=1 Tax=Dovyalis caffra TaxID=77055 RepID=A0AAV1SBM2_9ROSI|nr:unnamed protein product [Dovyalis caffra]
MAINRLGPFICFERVTEEKDTAEGERKEGRVKEKYKEMSRKIGKFFSVSCSSCEPQLDGDLNDGRSSGQCDQIHRKVDENTDLVATSARDKINKMLSTGAEKEQRLTAAQVR